MSSYSTNDKILTGECLCGSVKFEVEPPYRNIITCYCSECRKTSGNFVAASAAHEDQIHFIEQSGLAWFSNELADRGFCQICGSSMLWKKRPYDGEMSIMAGCLDKDTGLMIDSHIYVQEKNDFHEVAGKAPQYALEN